MSTISFPMLLDMALPGWSEVIKNRIMVGTELIVRTGSTASIYDVMTLFLVMEINMVCWKG